jgi:hypothetical protein
LGIPTVKDRVVQRAVKIVIEPLCAADFLPCSFGFRPKKTPRMALRAIVQSVHEGYAFVVDVDWKSYFDTISQELLLELVERRVGDVQVLRLIRAWLKAGVMEEGKVPHPERGSPQGGGISATSFCTTQIVNGAGATESPAAVFGWSVRRTIWFCGRGRNNRHGRRGSNGTRSWPLIDWW